MKFEYYGWDDGTSLYHHGIPGMKWGVRNGPPYPLGSEQKTKREKKKDYQDEYYAKTKDNSKLDKNNKQHNNSVTLTTDNGYKTIKTIDWNTGKSVEARYESSESRISSRESSKTKAVDRILAANIDSEDDGYVEGDWDAAQKFDVIGSTACEIYMKDGPKAAQNYLKKELKGVSYNIHFRTEGPLEVQKNGEWILLEDYGIPKEDMYYTSFHLDVFGSNFGYGTSGSSDYTDDQYFFSKDAFARHNY